MIEQILDLADDIYILLSQDFKILYFNNMAKKCFVNLQKEVFYKDIFTNTNEDEIQRLDSYLQDENSSNISYIFAFEGFYFNLKIKKLENNYLLEMKSFEKNYFIDVMEQSNIAFVLTEPQTQKAIYVSDYFCKTTGYSKEEILNNNLNILKVDDTDKNDREKVKEAIKNKIPVYAILKNKKKNGDIFYNKIAISPIFNKTTNRLQFFLGVQCDVTNKVVERLYYQAILDISKSIIVVTNGQVLKSVNKRFFEITGFNDLKDFKTKHSSISELFVQKDESYIISDMNGIPWNIYVKENPSTKLAINKVCLIDKEGRERIFQIETSGKILGEENEVITLTEITIILKNRKLLQEQTKHAAMGEMIAMIAHQWRQPLATLNTIYSKISVMYKMNLLTPEKFQESYDKSKNIVEHLSETINDFRNFFHNDEIYEKVSIKKLIEKSTQLLDVNLKINNISLEIGYENGIENSYLNINVSKITQVLLNLLKNAFDELEAKIIEEKYVRVQVYLDDEFLNICVKDNAGGVPQNIMGKIFEPYFSTKSKNGTGLGLYMSKMIIEEHLKGVLEVQNIENGACFTIKIPKKFIIG